MKKIGTVSHSLNALVGRPQPTARTRDGSGYVIPACRRGKKAVMAWTNPEADDLLREICYENRISKQQLMREFINLGLRKYGKPEIA